MSAGENATIRFTVKNTGKGAAREAYATLILIPDNTKIAIKGGEMEESSSTGGDTVSSLLETGGGQSADRIAIGDIPAGADLSGRFTIEAQEDIATAAVAAQVKIQEKNFSFSSVKLVFKTTSVELPKLAVTSHNIAGENGSKTIKQGDVATVSFAIQNQGRGKAQEVQAYLDSGQKLEVVSSPRVIGEIQPGKIATVSYQVIIPEAFKDQALQLSLTVNEKRPSIKAAQDVTVPVVAKGTEEQKYQVADTFNSADLVTYPPSEVDENIPEYQKDNSNGIAVVMGVRDYMNKDIPTVDYAIHDAEAVKDYLIKMYGFKEENILFYANPTKSKMEAVFGTAERRKAKLAQMVKPGESKVFVYFSGHGTPALSEDGRAYFAPSDCDLSQVSFTGYPVDVFYKNLSLLKAAKTTVVIDACFSGGSEKGTLVKGASPLLLTQKVTGVIPEGVQVFSASEANQVASWYDEKAHGVFTYYFLKGLQSGIRDSGKLKDFLQREVPTMVHKLKGEERVQKPYFSGNQDQPVVP